MRVHGDKVICRRKNISVRKNYRDYLPELAEDFQHICGYCGKSEQVTKNTFEPDHFVPVHFAPERTADYQNLVYSCYVCNRTKSGKWPSGDKDLSATDEEGFIDPASEIYDQHLERTPDGRIIGKTKVGKYMVSKGFKFDQRPMEEIWKAMQLIEKKKRLMEKIRSLSKDEMITYMEFDQMLSDFQSYLFGKKE